MKTVMKITLGIILAFVLLIGGCSALLAGSMDAATDNGPHAKVQPKADTELEKALADDVDEAFPTEEVEEPEAPIETSGEANARSKAGDYLDMSAFSRSGLIEQLEFEGFSTPDATYGVDAQQANWREQAALKAAEYLDMSSFSHSGLVEQLEFEGFTSGQAEFGVTKAGI